MSKRRHPQNRGDRIETKRKRDYNSYNGGK